LKNNSNTKLKVFLKGMTMGIADVIPGVSGGTIALITGIYEELINSIDHLNLKALSTLKKEGLNSFWNKINGKFSPTTPPWNWY
jgi:putative membrane protein